MIMNRFRKKKWLEIGNLEVFSQRLNSRRIPLASVNVESSGVDQVRQREVTDAGEEINNNLNRNKEIK